MKEAYEATIELITRRRGRDRRAPRGPRAFRRAARGGAGPEARRRVALDRGARGCAACSARARRVILGFDDRADVTEFASSADAPAAQPGRPGHARPHDLHQAPALLRAISTGAADPGGRPGRRWRARSSASSRTTRPTSTAIAARGVELLDALPRVVLLPGLGMFTAGKDARTAGIVNDIYHHTISVIGAATAFGRYVSLSAQDAFDVEYWPLELYKLTLAPPEKELARRIALVTGGGSRHRPRRRPAPRRRGRARRGHRLDARAARRVADEVTRRSAAGARSALRHGRHQRGLGPGGVRGDRARLRRPRHPGLQRRHRALRRRSTAWRWPTGSARSR